MGNGQSEVIRNHAALIWSVADLLRGDYKQSEYGQVILPLTVLRRLDCVLAPTKDAVLALAAQARRQDRAWSSCLVRADMRSSAPRSWENSRSRHLDPLGAPRPEK